MALPSTNKWLPVSRFVALEVTAAGARTFLCVLILTFELLGISAPKTLAFSVSLLRILRTLKVSQTRDCCKLNGVCCLVVDLEKLLSEVREITVLGWITPEMSVRTGFMKNSNQSEDWLSCFAGKKSLHTLSLNNIVVCNLSGLCVPGISNKRDGTSYP